MVWGGVATGGDLGQTILSDLSFFFQDGETDKKIEKQIETDKPPYLSNEN